MRDLHTLVGASVGDSKIKFERVAPSCDYDLLEQQVKEDSQKDASTKKVASTAKPSGKTIAEKPLFKDDDGDEKLRVAQAKKKEEQKSAAEGKK